MKNNLHKNAVYPWNGRSLVSLSPIIKHSAYFTYLPRAEEDEKEDVLKVSHAITRRPEVSIKGKHDLLCYQSSDTNNLIELQWNLSEKKSISKMKFVSIEAARPNWR